MTFACGRLGLDVSELAMTVTYIFVKNVVNLPLQIYLSVRFDCSEVKSCLVLFRLLIVVILEVLESANEDQLVEHK